MSPILAIALVSLLHIALLAPIAIAVLRPSAILPLGVAYALLAAGIASYQSGLFEPATIPRGGVPDITMDTALSQSQCGELLTLLDQASVIVDRRTPPHLVVAESQWAQLPEEARQAVVSCVQRHWPAGAPAAQIEVGR